MQYRGTTLTDEQAHNATTIIAGGDHVIQAPPGSGKTFQLLATARKLRGRGLSISFNKQLALEAGKKFARHIYCKTGHSLAFGALGYRYKDRLVKITGASLARNYDIGSCKGYRTAATKAYLILETIRQFCYSANERFEDHHVPKLPTAVSPDALKALRADIVLQARRIFYQMSLETSKIPITHDVYLKLWALSKPQLHKDFILFDEYQDANPVISDVIHSQVDCQKIFVGDQFQQIYAWRGAVNAIANTDINRLYITRSFRFGQAIADIANDLITHYYPQNDLIYKPFFGNAEREAIVDNSGTYQADCIIARTNNGVIVETFTELAKDNKVYILGGVKQIITLIKGITELKLTQKSRHPELMLFRSYHDLVEYSESSFGGDLRALIRILDKHGPEAIIKVLNLTEKSASRADVTITTAHKVKGLEYPIVRLANDFKVPFEDENPSPEETNILYVASTRALEVLDISRCQAAQPSCLGAAKRINDKIIKKFKESMRTASTDES
ncbi:MAG: ATP-dependent helicase [Planctomycetes bacterium]|nr:ATP-dependent helicase [Planctomycetota bacterium]